MDIKNIPFNTTNWSQIPATEHKGDTGTAYWHTQQFDNIRVRLAAGTRNGLTGAIAPPRPT